MLCILPIFENPKVNENIGKTLNENIGKTLNENIGKMLTIL